MAQSKSVDASPTKEFFITMLTRDIGLSRAILDLVDNSVDGAKRFDSSFENFSIKITAKPEYFEILDNCGGFNSETATKYAFRFGRPKEVEPTSHSVGLFGVGMKRAIFKLGTRFKVESRTDDEHFLIEENIETWKETEEWKFELSNVTDGEVDNPGTLLRVDNLLEQVEEEFDDENFIIKLGNEIKEAHIDSLNNGLTIILNGNKLKTKEFEILNSEELLPGYKEFSLNESSESPVNVKIITGISKPSPKDAGWYIFCNDRLVLEANRSFLTGWGEGNGKTVPTYHNDFARFRGFVYLDSEDPRKLPCNTTKTGVDANSAVYKTVRSRMINAMQPVISCLRDLRKEKSSDQLSKTILQDSIDEASTMKTSSIKNDQKFSYPDPEKPPKKKNKNGRISYKKPIEEINEVKNALQVDTYKEVGKLTFEYFYQIECN